MKMNNSAKVGVLRAFRPLLNVGPVPPVEQKDCCMLTIGDRPIGSYIFWMTVYHFRMPKAFTVFRSIVADDFLGAHLPFGKRN